MGSALRLPIVTDAKREAVFSQCRERKIKIIASTPAVARAPVLEDAAKAQIVRLCSDVDMTVPFALIVGREATGVSAKTAEQADECVHIPMAEGVESLNVAAAAAMLLYEAARQRGFRFKEPR